VFVFVCVCVCVCVCGIPRCVAGSLSGLVVFLYDT